MVDIQGFISKTKLLLTDPKAAWQQISGESSSIKDLYIKYLIAGLGLEAVCRFVKGSLIGHGAFGFSYKTPIVQGILFGAFVYLLGLGAMYVGGWLVNFLAPKFGGADNQDKAFSFVAHSAFPRIITAPLILLPIGISSMIALIIGLYSIYISFQGITPMTGVPEDSRFKFLGALVGIGIVIAIFFTIICASLFGTGMR